MRTAKINGFNVRMFDSIDELPIHRHFEFNKMLMLESGIGSDLNAISAHCESMYKYAQEGKTKELMLQIQNYNACLINVAENVDFKIGAFFALVYSINGEILTDFSRDNIGSLIKMLDRGTRKNQLVKLMFDSKKKIDQEIELLYPFLVSTETKIYYDNLKLWTLRTLNSLLGDEVKDEIKRIDELLHTFTRPRKLIGKDGAIVKYKKNFDEMILILTKHYHLDVSQITTAKFYQSFELLKKTIKPQKGKGIKHG